MVLLRKEHSLELWKLGRSQVLPSASLPGVLPLEEEPLKLAQINAKKAIVASALSQDWLSYATFKNLVVLNRTPEKLTKVGLLCEPITGVVDEIKINDNGLMTVSTGVTLYVFKLDPMGVILDRKLHFKSGIHSHCLSNEYMVMSLSTCKVLIYETVSWQEIGTFEVSCLPTALDMNPFQRNHLWAALSNHKLIQFDIKSMKFIHSLHCEQLDPIYAVLGFCFSNESVVVYDENHLYLLVPGKGVRTVSEDFRHIVKMGNIWGRDHELFVVELTPQAIFKRLPAALVKKGFGT
jgi:hypothetical protein